MNGEVRIDNLTKTYVTRQRRGLFRSAETLVPALKGVSLSINPGELFGLLGPNGAGKTTLIKCLTTLLLPTGGDAWINGFQLTREPNAVRATVGCMLMGERGLYWKLTGRENLVFFGALYHLDSAERQRRADAVIRRLGMTDYADRAVETYSSGQKMKLAFGKALLNDAPVLILDEPTNTLDVPSAHELRDMVRALNRDEGKTIIYTTHIMAEAESLCDRVAIVDRGELIAMGAVDELKRAISSDTVIQMTGIIPGRATGAVQTLPGVKQAVRESVNGHEQLTIVAQSDDHLLPRLIDTLSRNGATLQRIEPKEVTLEDVFMRKTGRSLTEDTSVR